MSKLVDVEKLARLATALDNRAKSLVEAEEQRAKSAEQAIEAKADANATAIEAINNAENGILAQAKNYIDEEIVKVNDTIDEKEQALDERIGVLEGAVLDEEGIAKMKENIAANKAAIDVLNGGVDEEGSVAKAINDAVEPVQSEVDDVKGRVTALEAEQDIQDTAIQAAQAAADKAQGEVTAVEGRMTDAEGRLDDLDAEQDTQDAAIQTAQAAADKAQGEVDAVEGRVTAVEGRMTDAEGRLDDLDAEQDEQDNAIQNAQAAANAAQAEVDAVEIRVAAVEETLKNLDVEGSVSEAIEEAIEPIQSDINNIKAEIGDPVEGDNPATGMYAYIDAGDAKALQDAKNYADQQITALVDSAPEAMNTLRELAEEITNHQDVYDAYVAEVAEMLNGKVDKVENHRLVSETEITKWNGKAEITDVEEALGEAKSYADGQVAAVQGEVDAVELRVDALEAKVGNDVNGENPATGLFLEVDQAKAAADAAQADVDAVEGRADALEAEQGVQNEAIAANKAAIDKLNGGVEVEGSIAKSIADALEDYSTTEEVKVILGNVVSSLALTMENDKVVLRLGGEEGISITEVSLHMATNEDIDNIVNGLDTEGE